MFLIINFGFFLSLDKEIENKANAIQAKDDLEFCFKVSRNFQGQLPLHAHQGTVESFDSLANLVQEKLVQKLGWKKFSCSEKPKKESNFLGAHFVKDDLLYQV